MTREEWTPYIVAWRKRRHRAIATTDKRIETARSVAQECARVLIEQYGARRVWLFGSLAHRRFVHARSDIDLAVEGLLPEKYFRALAVIWELLPSGLKLDLVPLEDARPDLVDIVREEGELLYGKA